MTPAIRHPHFCSRSHIKSWTNEVLRTARLVWGDTCQYHMIVKRVLQIRRKQIARFKDGCQ